MDLMSLTAVELGKRIRAGEVSVREAAEAALAAAGAREEQVHSFVTLEDIETIMKRADEVQKLIDSGTLSSPLAGVPVAIKDNMCTEGLLTTCSSRILENFRPTYTAEAVLNLERAGAVEVFSHMYIPTKFCSRKISSQTIFSVVSSLSSMLIKIYPSGFSSRRASRSRISMKEAHLL